jgi:membrane protein DedA with SNARE-associated domain
VLRQLNGVVAGTLGMNWWRFLLFNALGGALWVATWVLGAYYLGEHMSDITRLAHHVGVAGGMLAAAVLLFGLVVLVRRLRRGWAPGR